MTILATVPMTVLAAILIAQQAQASKNQLEADLLRASLSFALTIEREIASSTDALRLLSMSEPLQRGDLAGIFTSLSAAPKPRNSWSSAFLVDLDGDVLFNTEQPPGRPLGRFGDMAAFERLKRTGQAVVTDMTAGPDGQSSTGILVPVVVDGRVTGALGAWIPPSSWLHLITTMQSTQDGFMTVFDSRMRIVARNKGGPGVIGALLTDTAQQRIHLHGTSGMALLDLVDGGKAYGAWHTIQPTGWGVIVGEPAAPFDRSYFISIGAALAMGVLSLAGGMLLAMWVARRVTEPLRGLAHHGPRAGGQQPTTVHELRQLEQELLNAELQREATRERLQAKADEFETLFQSSPIGLAMTQGPDCESVLRNPALVRMLNEPGSPEDARTVLPRTGWPLHQIRRQGKTLPLHEQPLQKAARSGERQRDVEIDVVHDNGHMLKLIAHAVPLLDAHGKPRGAIASFTDLTERKQAEESLSTAERRLRESQHLMELAQAAGHVGFFNRDFRDDTVTWTSGLSRLFGLNLSDFVGPWDAWMRRLESSDRQSVQAAINAATAAGDDHSTFDFRVRLEDGSQRWLFTRVSILYDEGADGGSPRPTQMHGAVVDVTQQKLIDHERAALVERETHARMEAESANRAKDEFLAMLGHELRNPLGAMAAACEVLNRAQGHEDVAQRARLIITRQTRHLGRLMDDLLDVARVISGKVLLVREPLRLDQLAQRVFNTFELAGQLHAHEVELDAQEAWVHADTTRMEQVITNLLGNAIKYTPHGGHIRLSVQRGEDEVVLAVQDSGVGMSDELMARAFDLFAQGERSLDRRQGGLGIGLTLVKRLVELHGGIVDVASPGLQQGSTFTLHLPPIAPDASVQRREALPVQGRKVVVVEDNDDAREALCAMLALGRHETGSAEDGLKGVDLIARTAPDVALIDIGLPGLTGYEVAKRLRAQGYQGWLVALSGYGQAEDLQRSRAAGFDEHLVKPVNADKLDRVMALCAEVRAMQPLPQDPP